MHERKVTEYILLIFIEKLLAHNQHNCSYLPYKLPNIFYQCDRIILYEDEATFSKVNKLNPNSIELSNPIQRAQFEKANKYAKQYCQSETS